jgi:hypothetical protein
MKWIGQNIYDLVSRFRNSVYLEDISTGTIASGGNLGLDSNNKIVKAAEATGDITSVVAGTNITGGGTSGDVTLNVATANTTTKGVVELATTAETTTGTDTARAVTPDGLKDGYQGSTNIVTVGAVGTGTWKGTAIASNYLDADTAHLSGTQTFSGTKTFSNTISGSIDGQAATVATIAGLAPNTATTQATQAAITTCANLTTVGTIGTGVWQGTAIAQAYIAGDAINGDKIADNAVDSEHYTDGSIDTAHIADDQVTFAKASGVTPNIFGSVIKLIPSDFMANDDGGNTKFGVGYVDDPSDGALYGMRPGNNAVELFAFVSIPEGMTATHVDIFDKNDVGIIVYEAQINATTMVSKGTGNCNTTVDITDVASTATNFLAIQVTTTSVNDKIYGGRVTIA